MNSVFTAWSFEMPGVTMPPQLASSSSGILASPRGSTIVLPFVQSVRRSSHARTVSQGGAVASGRQDLFGALVARRAWCGRRISYSRRNLPPQLVRGRDRSQLRDERQAILELRDRHCSLPHGGPGQRLIAMKRITEMESYKAIGMIEIQLYEPEIFSDLSVVEKLTADHV